MANELKITFTGGALLGDEQTISLADPVLIGRSHSAGIRLTEADVSGRHVELRMEGGRPCAVCLSRHGFSLNSLKVAEGESRPIGKGDVLSLGTKVRIRIDEVMSGGGEASRVAEADSVTFETRAMTMMAEATMSTRPAPESMTFETRMPSGTLSSGMDASLQGSMEEFPVTDSDSVPAAPRPPVDDSPTEDDPMPAFDLPPPVNGLPPANESRLAAKSFDTLTDFDVPPDDVPTGVSTGTGDGETIEMKTRPASMDEIFRMKRMLEAKKRFRRKLVSFSLLLFLALLATVVFVTWSRPEEELSQPRVAGTDQLDLAQYIVKSPSGGVDMVVDYPNDPRMKVSESQDGIDVTTYTGRDRDATFRLSFTRRSDMHQYHLSLAESAALEVSALEKKGYVFLSEKDDPHLDPESRAGFLFYEQETPLACQIKVQHGTRFFRREYQREDGDVKWHGMMILLRNRDEVYRLLREVPDDLWPRASYMFHIDPNLSLYAGFLRRRWESPGAAALAGITADERLEHAVSAVLSRGRTVDWPRIAKEIDALVVAAAIGSTEARKRADELLFEFRKRKDNLYREVENQRDAALYNRNEDKLNDAWKQCYGAFGDDPSDLRSHIVLDPEVWPRCLPESF